MAKKVEPAPKGRRTAGKKAVASARRTGPGKGFWIGLAVIVLGGGGTLVWQAMQPKATSRAIDPTLPKLKAEGYLLGSPSAPVEIVEFADFECPSCGQFATLTEPDVRAKLVNTGQARIRYMDFPLPMHRNTWDASFAAACANEQGKFWQMHDIIFQNQDRWNGEATSRPKKVLGELAQSLGLDMAKYNACVDSEKYRAQIQANEQEGERRGVNQTPTFMIGDKIYPGALSWDSFKKYVDEEAAKAKPAADTGKKGT
jgi:protein-disulfide isomerase